MHFGPILRSLFRNKSRAVLAIGMTALALAIVVNCLQMILVARAEMRRRSGFDEEHLVSLSTRPFDEAFRDEEHRLQVVREDLARLRARPEVVSATATHFLPWRGGGSSWECKAEGSEAGFQRMQLYPAGPDLAETLGVELVAGRALTQEETDDPESTSVVISKALADLFYPDGDAVGKYLELPTPGMRYHVVGVIDPFYNPYAWSIEEYVAFWAGYRTDEALSYLVRVEPSAASSAGGVGFLEELLLAANAGRNVETRTVPETRERYFGAKVALVQTLGLIIVLMVAVTSIGVFGMTHFSVAQRTRQIGTRRALGARRRDILAQFLTENWLITTLGITLGVALAVGLNVALRETAGAPRLEVGLVAGAVLFLWALNLGAAFLPALRSTRVPPALATRSA